MSSCSRGTARAEIIPLLMFRVVVVSPSSGYSFTLYMLSTTTFRGYLKTTAWIFIFVFLKNIRPPKIIAHQNKLSHYLSMSAAKTSDVGADPNTGLPSKSTSITSLSWQPVVRTMKLHAWGTSISTCQTMSALAYGLSIRKWFLSYHARGPGSILDSRASIDAVQGFSFVSVFIPVKGLVSSGHWKSHLSVEQACQLDNPNEPFY